MKNGRFSDAQTMLVLKQSEGGVPVIKLCREHGMSSTSFYRWRAKFGGMDASLMSEMKDLADENRRLKRIFTKMSMQNDILKEALGSSPFSAIGPKTIDVRVKAVSEARDDHERGCTTQGPLLRRPAVRFRSVRPAIATNAARPSSMAKTNGRTVPISGNSINF